MRVRHFSLAVTLLAVVLALAPATRAATPVYQTVKLPDAGGGTEPRITIAPDGRRYVITNVPGNALVYGSNDGLAWTQLGPIAGQTVPTIDVDIVALNTGRLVASELDTAGLNFPTSYSDDGGKTWTPSVGSTGLIDQDRQWYAVGPNDPTTGKPRVYFLYHNLASGSLVHNMWLATSTDGGATFGVPVPVAVPPSEAFADLQCSDSGGPSGVTVNPKTGQIYVFFTTRAAVPIAGGPDFGGCGASVFGPPQSNIVSGTRVWVATSPDNTPGSWVDSLAVDRSATGQIVSMQLAYGALDNQGGVWVAFPESPRPYPDFSGAAVKVTHSDAKLSAWSPPATLVPVGGPGSTLVHLAVGDPGKIDVAYYKGVESPGGKPLWYTHIIQSLNAGDANPAVDDQQVSDIPAYQWTASEMMGACNQSPGGGVVGGYTCSRSTDVWGITLDSQCRVSIAWPTVGTDTPKGDAGTFVTTQTGGQDLCHAAEALPGSPSVGPLLPKACVAGHVPLATLARGAVKATRKGVALHGQAPACVTRVAVAIGRVSGKRLRFLRANRRFGAPKRLSGAIFQPARGSTSWAYSVRAKLPAGRYLALVRTSRTKGRAGTRQLRFTVH